MASIFHLPRVSGTATMTKRRAAAQRSAYSQKTAAAPMVVRSQRKVFVTRKVDAQLVLRWRGVL